MSEIWNKIKTVKCWSPSVSLHLCSDSLGKNKLYLGHLIWTKAPAAVSFLHHQCVVCSYSTGRMPFASSSFLRVSSHWVNCLDSRNICQSEARGGQIKNCNDLNFCNPKLINSFQCFTEKKSYCTNKSVPFCCIPQKASWLPGTEPQFGPVRNTNMEELTDENLMRERDTKRQTERGKDGGYLLFDVNLWQALQFGGVFWNVCGWQKQIADTCVIG